MSVFPLEPLSRVRNVRLRCAQTRVSERRAELNQAERVRDGIKQRLQAAKAHRGAYLEQWVEQMSTAAHSAEWAKQHESHLDLLDNSIASVKRRLADAEEKVQAALNDLQEAVAQWRKIQAKCDALESMRADWQQDQDAEQERLEECAIEEVRLARSGA